MISVRLRQSIMGATEKRRESLAADVLASGKEISGIGISLLDDLRRGGRGSVATGAPALIKQAAPGCDVRQFISLSSVFVFCARADMCSRCADFIWRVGSQALHRYALRHKPASG